MVKAAWVVSSMDLCILCDDHGEPQEFATEKAALKKAKEWVQTSEETEAWVFKLSHLVSRPDTEPTVEAVK